MGDKKLLDLRLAAARTADANDFLAQSGSEGVKNGKLYLIPKGLLGHGRLDAPTRWGASVYVQLIDPDAFAGCQAFIDQMDFLADSCHANAPIDPDRPVRLPGEQASRRIADANAKGVLVSPETIAGLRTRADRLGVTSAPF
jgi:Malate/L-lactate dehydrogenase